MRTTAYIEPTYIDPKIPVATIELVPLPIPDVNDDTGPADLGDWWLDLGCGD